MRWIELFVILREYGVPESEAYILAKKIVE